MFENRGLDWKVEMNVRTCLCLEAYELLNRLWISLFIVNIDWMCGLCLDFRVKMEYVLGSLSSVFFGLDLAILFGEAYFLIIFVFYLMSS